MEIKHKQFTPYARVLVRDAEDKWQIDFYSHWSNEKEQHITLAYGDGLRIEDADILPYEGHEDLLGTTQEPEEEIELEEGEWIIGIQLYDLNDFLEGKIYGCMSPFQGFGNRFELSGISTSYAIRFSDFNPADMEETRRHILCIKNGKIIRYKE